MKVSRDRRRIRVKFVDQCIDQHDVDNYLYPYLAKFWDVEIVKDDPEYLFCSVFGREHLKYDCVKILFSGENVAPDFNWYDYALGQDDISFGDRYIRAPLYGFSKAYRKLKESAKMRAEQDSAKLLNRGFCSFVVSNPNADPLRDRFFERLSAYKPVASGGRHLNNVGGPVADKLEFCSRYKFNIAFENSAVRGYTTEKIVEPLAAMSVPVYWGNPDIEKDFPSACMVRVRDESDVERAVEEIIRLDNDDAAYLEKCRAETIDRSDVDWFENRVDSFLTHIIDQPIESAARLAKAGMQRNYRSYQRHALGVYDVLHRFVPKFVRGRK